MSDISRREVIEIRKRLDKCAAALSVLESKFARTDDAKNLLNLCLDIFDSVATTDTEGNPSDEVSERIFFVSTAITNYINSLPEE